MEKELGAEVIKATQTSLGKYVKRPPLSEKLLKKPPFRFLHDIVTSVLKTNGFFEGLFEEDELVSENVKDRDSKILFLNKVISVIALTTGKNLSVKPSKIVAGQEPEKTNELLQTLAYALDKKLSSNEAVQKFKENTNSSQVADIKTKEKEIKPVKKSSDAKKNTTRSSEKLTNSKKESAPINKNEKNKSSDPKSKRKETSLSKVEPQVKKTQNLKAVGKKSSAEVIKSQEINDIQDHQEQNSVSTAKDIKQDQIIIDEITSVDALRVEKHAIEAEPSIELNTFRTDQEVQGKLNSSYTITENELNSSLSSQDLMDVENEKADDDKSSNQPTIETSEIKIEDRINEANKESIAKAKEELDGPVTLKNPRPVLIPKYNSFDSEIKAKELVRTNSHDVNPTNSHTSEVVRPPSVRPSSSRPGAPRLREKIDNVIPENDHLILGKVNIITENVQNDEEEDSSIIVVEHGLDPGTNFEDRQDPIQLTSNEHGHLVQQILNSQKELSQVTGKTEIEWQYGAQKAKEASSQEIEQLRFNIQALSRVANPLGKLLDHIQEDVEVMRQELQQWTDVYEEVSKDMLKQKAASEETLVPLQMRVKQLDMDIEEKRDKINDIKIVIHKNTARIEKLLGNGNMQ